MGTDWQAPGSGTRQNPPLQADPKRQRFCPGRGSMSTLPCQPPRRQPKAAEQSTVMPHSKSQRPWAWIVVGSLLAAPLSLVASLQLILIYMYGFEVLWEGVPESIERGPGDGFFMFLVPPFAFVLWLVFVAVVWILAPRLRDRFGRRAPSHGAA